VKKKILTLEDLVKFCKVQKLFCFSSKDTGYQICVHVPADFEKNEVENSSLLFADIKAFHTGRNRNESNVTVDAAKKSLDTFAYKPILAAFMTDENGVEDFMSHEMEIDDDGNIVYIEHQVGCFTTDKPKMKKDPDHEDRQYVYATAAIPRDYTHAADIIERKGGTKVSVELLVNEFQYDEEADELLLTDIEVSGLTLLGKDENGHEVQEGMEGARLDIKDFIKSKNSVYELNEDVKRFIQDSIVETLNNIDSQRKEENQMSHFDELLKKYGKTVEEIAFAYEGLSDEELDSAFAEAFENAPNSEDTEDANKETYELEFAVTWNGITNTFSKSLNDQIRDITELVNATYGAEDCAFYDCEVFDDKTVLFHDWWNNRHFKQKYGNKEGNLVLKGERTEVFVRYLTEEELTALDDLKSKFDAKVKEFDEIQEELTHYHDEPKKQEILNSKDYSSIVANEEFLELSKQDNHFSMSIEDVQAKADEILLNAAKSGKVDFSSHDENKISVSTKPLSPVNVSQKRYGSLLSNID
jgi:hypothetical protein